MPLKSLLLFALIFAGTYLLAIEVTIDASMLEGKSSIYISESSVAHRIPDSGVAILHIENLPTLIELKSINKGKVTTLKSI
jgi:hypothetical protein